MKRKFIMLLASCSLAIAIIIPATTAEPIVSGNSLMLIQIMGHGIGNG